MGFLESAIDTLLVDDDGQLVPFAEVLGVPGGIKFDAVAIEAMDFKFECSATGQSRRPENGAERILTFFGGAPKPELAVAGHVKAITQWLNPGCRLD